MATMTRFYLFMPAQMIEKLRVLSTKLGLPVSEIARNAVVEYMKKHED